MSMKKIHYIPQVDEKDCGVAALAMVLAKYRTRISLAQLRELAKTNIQGTTALGIVKAAEKLNFETIPVKANLHLFDKKDIQYPFIAHVNRNGKEQHYYVVYGFKGNNVLIADPDITVGKIKLTRENFNSEWTGLAIFIAPNPGYNPVKYKKKSLKNFIPVVIKQRMLIVNISIAAFLVTLISILGSYYLQGIIDDYIPSGMKGTLGIVSIGLILTYIIQQILSFIKEYLLIFLSQRLSIEIILSYIKHIFSLPMSFFATRRTGEIISRFTDANSIIEALASTMLSLILDVSIIMIVGTVLIIQNSILFFISLISIPIYILIIWIFLKPFSNMNNGQMQSNAILSSSIIENINGIETIKALNSEKKSYHKIDHEFVDYLEKSFVYAKTKVLQNTLKSLLMALLNVSVLWVGALLVIDNSLSIGQLVTYNALLVFFTNPLQNIINLQIKLQQASVANKRLNEVYLVESEFDDKSSSEEIKNGDINIKNVTYTYGFGLPTIDNVTCTIKMGQKIAIVGASGSGKSTLVKLLVNFFQPEKGLINLGDKPINSVDKHLLRKYITYLPQEPFIFSGTILENLLLGAPPGTKIESVIRATELAEIRYEIEKMPLGFKTELSDSGNISGGQKQRIALARALLADAPILILDESTSNLDILTETKIINNLLNEKEKTIVFVAHRLNIAKRVERIIIMHDGKIIEDGNHKELMLNNGTYATLYQN